jgi:hypothetical protein
MQGTHFDQVVSADVVPNVVPDDIPPLAAGRVPVQSVSEDEFDPVAPQCRRDEFDDRLINFDDGNVGDGRIIECHFRGTSEAKTVDQHLTCGAQTKFG